MTKKKALTGAIIIMVIWFAMWGFGYWYLSNQVNTASTRGFIEGATDFLSADDGFIDQYGQLTAIEAQDEAPISNESAVSTEYYMDFCCTTNTGEYTIRVYQTWNEEWTFRFEELPVD